MSKGLTFETSLKELQGIVSRLESGNIPLEESIAQFEKGMLLIHRCDEMLIKAEQRLRKGFKGNEKRDSLEPSL